MNQAIVAWSFDFEPVQMFWVCITRQNEDRQPDKLHQNRSIAFKNFQKHIICVTMILLNIVTSVYFSSLLLLALYTNIKPLFYLNIWNETEVIEKADNTDEAKLEDVDIIMIINLVVLSVVGKWSFIKQQDLKDRIFWPL